MIWKKTRTRVNNFFKLYALVFLILFSSITYDSLAENERIGTSHGYNILMIQLSVFMWLTVFGLISISGLPGLETLLILAVLFSIFDLNDNHRI